ncbi:MAG TPA: formylglycine-generating enzyme family protein [Gemmataceae bacterium]|nr:formylglycine-generating enzyme family protein [Gemmataceae bacterium]
MKKHHRKRVNDWPESKPAPQASVKQPWTTRQQLGAFALLLAGLLLAWFLLFPEEFGYAVGVVRGWFASTSEPSPAPVETAEINKTPPPGSAPEGMVWIPGGTFWMGSEDFPDATPVHLVSVPGFWMDKTEVTNAQFAKFVKATDYVTVAERRPNAKDFPKLRPEILGFQEKYGPELLAGYPTAFPFLPGTVAPTAGFPAGVPFGAALLIYPIVDPVSIVFQPPPRELVRFKREVLTPGEFARFKHEVLKDPANWWGTQRRACWRHPTGAGSDLTRLENHPVVHIAWEDAVAYAKWADKRLPTEAEWEFAARGGLDKKPFYWGDELEPNGKRMANIWLGDFPFETTKDCPGGTMPVASFPPNGYGLHDMAGNVWEWCSDWYRDDYYARSPKLNPQGPASSLDLTEPGLPKRVQRGGSFLCCDNYCWRYMAGARGKGEPESSASHIGFRCVRDAK